jgi:hypothetical protein
MSYQPMEVVSIPIVSVVMRCTYDTRSILKQIRQVLLYIYIYISLRNRVLSR